MMPYSVIMPVMRELSVTSNAGLYVFTASGAIGSLYHSFFISSPSRCSMTMSSPAAVSKSIVDVGAAI